MVEDKSEMLTDTFFSAELEAIGAYRKLIHALAVVARVSLPTDTGDALRILLMRKTIVERGG